MNNKPLQVIRTGSSRRGSLYISVILAGAVISAVALSAVLTGRIRLRAHQSISDSTVARLNAHAAIRLGLKAIEDNPDWRFGHSSDVWYQDRALGDGTFDLSVVDPSDNILDDASADPVVLRGIGRCGDSMHTAEMTLAPLYRGYDCLTSAIHAGDDVEINTGYDGAFHNGHIISANDDVKANSYTGVNGIVHASTAVEGQYYTGSAESGVDTKQIPHASKALSFYKEHGSWINISDLPNKFPNSIRNASFEDSSASWVSVTATSATDNSTAADGNSCLFISNRERHVSGVQQDVSHVIHSHRWCEFSLSIFPTTLNQFFYVHLEVSDNNGENDFVAGPYTGPLNQWTTVTGVLQPTFDDLTSARLLVNTASYHSSYSDDYASYDGNGSTAPADFRIDDVTFRESETVRNIDRVLLSPTNNPYGELNDSGIYVIDCAYQKVVIRNSRVFGTLVLLNPASSTVLGDDSPLVMSPAKDVYPTLLVENGEITINPSLSGLQESLLNVNFNPPDAPYGDFASNSELTDTFPSMVRGLVFCEEDITLENLSVSGTVIGVKDIFIRESFSMEWDNRFYRNPPPGFNGPEKIRLLLGSARRVAN